MHLNLNLNGFSWKLLPEEIRLHMFRFLLVHEIALVRRKFLQIITFDTAISLLLGQKFALMEEKVVLSTFLRHYGVKSLDPILSVRSIPDLISRPSNGFNVRIFARQ